MLNEKIQVLLVDDEPDLLHLMKISLQREGYTVDTCQNGENIQRLIHEHPPDIILLDIKMDGVDGGNICSMLKDDPLLNHIKIILFSANDNISVIAEKCGADAFLTKPYNKQQTQEVFEQVLSF